MICRQLYNNLVWDSDTTITVSSEQSGTPRAWLKDESPGLTWRSKVGYNPHALLNDQLPFVDDGTEQIAQLTVANYATPALYAAHITTQMNAASTALVNGYLCSYASSSALFTIEATSGTGTFELPFSTGSVTRSTHLDLGFTSIGQTGSTTYTGSAVSYKSREWITVDLGSTDNTVEAGVVIEHNLASTTATITQMGSTANTAAVWASPTVSYELTGNSTVRLNYPSTGDTLQYWRLLINDVSTTAGYSEVGVWYLGDYSDPSKNYRTYARKWTRLSRVSEAISGAHKRDVRSPRDVYSLSWVNITETDRDLLRAWINDALDKNLFLAFDPSGDPTDIVYGFFSSDPDEYPTSGRLWQVNVEFSEALP